MHIEQPANLRTNKAKAPEIITLRRMQREVGTGKPGYRWAPGYVVVRPDGAEEYPPVDFNDARARVRELTGSASAYRII